MAALLSLPIFTIASFLLYPSNEVWQHLRTDGAQRVSAEFCVADAGRGCRYPGHRGRLCLVDQCLRFPGKKFFAWALLMPLAFPGYIIAYTYTGMFDFAGPLQSWLRELTGWGPRDYYFPEIRSLGGAITMFTLVLYPYVYLLSRAAFLEQSVCVLEVSRTLGCSVWSGLLPGRTAVWRVRRLWPGCRWP